MSAARKIGQKTRLAVPSEVPGPVGGGAPEQDAEDQREPVSLDEPYAGVRRLADDTALGPDGEEDARDVGEQPSRCGKPEVERVRAENQASRLRRHE
jgi:hypothetical protein